MAGGEDEADVATVGGEVEDAEVADGDDGMAAVVDSKTAVADGKAAAGRAAAGVQARMAPVKVSLGVVRGCRPRKTVPRDELDEPEPGNAKDMGHRSCQSEQATSGTTRPNW
ncbi:hypothetical protein E2562_024064 [Oryza meyeriana var. granulata]|uniref:Uncharacterized protein n=1 Tax=Oryza meyeriana var. granulata TaxID=110450 RepID=A0A6G1CHX2_9ORYZ|nr:hypothetical protein E2562_024064 [Oryza meyeriana var. granulata]